MVALAKTRSDPSSDCAESSKHASPPKCRSQWDARACVRNGSCSTEADGPMDHASRHREEGQSHARPRNRLRQRRTQRTTLAWRLCSPPRRPGAPVLAKAAVVRYAIRNMTGYHTACRRSRRAHSRGFRRIVRQATRSSSSNSGSRRVGAIRSDVRTHQQSRAIQRATCRAGHLHAQPAAHLSTSHECSRGVRWHRIY